MDTQDADPQKAFVDHSLLIIALVMGAFFRIYHVGLPSLWLDELITYWVSSGTGWTSIITRSHCAFYSPLFGLIERAMLALFGRSELALRMPSVLAGIVSIPLVYRLGVQFFNRQVGALSSLMFAVNVDQIYYAQQARPYAICVMFTLISMMTLSHYLEEGGWRWQISYVLSTVTVIALQYTFMLLLLVQTLYWWYVVALDPLDRRRARVIDWLQTQALVVLALSPLAWRVYDAYRAASPYQRLWIDTPHAGQLLIFFDRLLVPLILIILGFLLYVVLSRKSVVLRWPAAVTDSKPLVLVLVWYVVPILLCFILARFSPTKLFLKRYLIVYAVPCYILLAYGFTLLQPRSWSYTLALSFVGVSILYDPVNAFREARLFAFHDEENWRPAIRYLNTVRGRDEPILVESGDVLEARIPFLHDPLCQEYALAPLSFYRLSAEQVIPLTFLWDPVRFHDYYEQTVWPSIVASPAFWLLIRRGHPEPYIQAFESWLTQQRPGHVRRIGQKDFGGVSVIRYARSSHPLSLVP